MPNYYPDKCKRCGVSEDEADIDTHFYCADCSEQIEDEDEQSGLGLIGAAEIKAMLPGVERLQPKLRQHIAEKSVELTNLYPNGLFLLEELDEDGEGCDYETAVGIRLGVFVDVKSQVKPAVGIYWVYAEWEPGMPETFEEIILIAPESRTPKQITQSGQASLF